MISLAVDTLMSSTRFGHQEVVDVDTITDDVPTSSNSALLVKPQHVF